ncbi:phytoene desaturase family protein [Alteromonas lipotrueae]|uniref:phytoene desaturase family protein n=1 Tax=Alteromonas lipotrueae TaxID=2803814 RepID=UPI001C47383D|nr:NAD(P)/FAD-dependent oxidoreductase [Alteromonas lipotrueae]
MSHYDVVVMGAGHNGLVAAAYMAKAGKKVIVLERQPFYGGGVTTRELMTPGYFNDEHSATHVMILANPLIQNDELGLQSKFGLSYDYMDRSVVSVWDDGTVLVSWKDLDRTCEELAKVSPRDAEMYRQFVQAGQKVLPMMMTGLAIPPTPLGAFVAMMDQSDQGRFMFDMMQRSARDIIEETFENELVKLHLLRAVAEALINPDDLGTGIAAFMSNAMLHTYGGGVPKGGSGKLSESLVKCIEHYGGEVRCDAEVARVIVSSGKATGLELINGETFMAKDGVIGAIHPHVLDKFVEGVPEPVVKRAKRVTTTEISVNMIHLNLKKQASLKVGKEYHSHAVELMDFYTVRDMCMEFDKIRRGVPSSRLIGGFDVTHTDPSRAPAGSGVFYGVHLVPAKLHEGGLEGWDESKEAIADEALAQYRKFYDGIDDDNIIARHIGSPMDHQRYSPNSFLNGDIHGAANPFYQSMGHRPTPDLGDFRVPEVESLYLVGPAMHPGGGVTGGGRATAIQMMDDLGIDYDKVFNEEVR